jgi:hypothetical protein
MTAEVFRKMALEFPQAVEGSHMDHPDFRVDGKIFATLGYPNKNGGMVKLTPEQQRAFVKEAPGVFIPCSGAWGLRGSTNVHLASAKKNVLRPALEAAVGNVAAKAKKQIGGGNRAKAEAGETRSR